MQGPGTLQCSGLHWNRKSRDMPCSSGKPRSIRKGCCDLMSSRAGFLPHQRHKRLPFGSCEPAMTPAVVVVTVAGATALARKKPAPGPAAPGQENHRRSGMTCILNTQKSIAPRSQSAKTKQPKTSDSSKFACVPSTTHPARNTTSPKKNFLTTAPATQQT